jgi:hypothetical protein
MLASFVISLAYGGGMPSQVLRTIHVGFLCLLAGGMLAQHGAGRLPAKAFWWAAGGLAFVAGLYHWEFYRELVNRPATLPRRTSSSGFPRWLRFSCWCGASSARRCP